MSAERFDLLVAGELNPDAIVVAEAIEPEYGQVERLVDDGVLTIGSSGAIVACGAARLGMRTAYVGVVGDDDSGASCCGELRRRDVDIDALPGRPRAGDRAQRRAQPGRRPGDPDLRRSDGRPHGRRRDRRDAGRDRRTCTSPRRICRPGSERALAELFGRRPRPGASTSLDPGWDPSGALGR